VVVALDHGGGVIEPASERVGVGSEYRWLELAGQGGAFFPAISIRSFGVSSRVFAVSRQAGR
jgi:hypothetical protein